MVREQLQTAADDLRTAIESAEDDASERLTELAEKLDALATDDRGPDHGSMARIQNTLNDIKEDVEEDAVEAIDDAKAKISDYRSTVEGV
ncbi:hypothetical protein ACFR9U_01110 [Halorientalis brevis]|uniref:Uncharacterized protein n=1 Tax=Halorientalis brevis TaxID=1126241 RepID=A0ABD6C6A9_9EURY|nr:hypothetical protein [Halorientalis brevis]